MILRSAWLPALVVFIGCQTSSALTDSDPMQPSAPSPAGPPMPCPSCFDDACAWETLECASDPGCASWLTCARECPSGEKNLSETCLQGCPEPPSTTGDTLKDVLLRCVGDTRCCGEEREDPASGEAGVEGSIDGRDASYSTISACNTDGCGKCLMEIKAGMCGEDEACTATMHECYHEGDTGAPRACWDYLSARACVDGPTGNTGCSYAVQEASLPLTLRALECAATYCPQCVGDSSQACVVCQLASCSDEMVAVLTSTDAQELLQCRADCRGVDDPAGCNQSCLQQYEDGKDAVITLYVCSQDFCKMECGAS